MPVTSTLKQCKSCRWRVDCDPDADIPGGYSRKLHRRKLHRDLRCTIADGSASLRPGGIRAMACHYSPVGQEHACAGWLHNQLGPGNNIAVRMAVMVGRLPVPEVEGEQHETFETTMPKGQRRRHPK